MINALVIKELLEEYSDEELKRMKVRIQNLSFDYVNLEIGDNFRCDDVNIKDEGKELVIEF